MKKLLPVLLIAAILLSVSSSEVSAFSPYTTWAVGPGGNLYPSQDAYTPLDEVDLPISAAEELFYAPDGFLYVADTGNGRIIKLDEKFEVAAEYGVGLLQAPTGLFVDEEGVFYIADAGKNTIVILDKDGNLVNEFGRPSEPLFGKRREFLPRKISVDVRKNLYIISEASVDGLVMLNTNGNFIGYFGANSARMSLEMILQRAFLSEEQLSQFIKNEAASPSNLAIDNQSLIYTITAGTSRDTSIRKFNIAGKNLIEQVFGSQTFRDIHVSEDGLMTAVDADGLIYEYDLDGTLLFVFGGPDTGDQRLGLLSKPASIERVGDKLYVLDQDKNAIIIYQATEFANKVHAGISLYMDGFYVEAKPYFEEVLTNNGLFIMSYQAIADAYYKQGDYAQAIQAYRYAEDRGGYSDAYWELRNAVLQRQLGNAMMAVVGVWAASSIFTHAEKRKGWLEPVRRWLQGLSRYRLVDDFLFMFRFIKQPSDSFYYIKKNKRGSLTFAFIIYAWVLAARILSLYLTGFTFSPYPSPAWIPVENEMLYVVMFVFLWNAANYLVSTITDGDGSVRQVIIGSAYSLFPIALFALPIALISNVLTMNEVFIYNFLNTLMWVWTGIMLVIMVKEVHNYSFSATLRNVLTTLFTMALFLLTGYILYILFNQLYEFVLAIIQEVGLRG